MVFQQIGSLCSKICVYNKLTEQVNCLKYLVYYITYENKKNYIKITLNISRTMEKLDQVLKPYVVQIQVRRLQLDLC